MTDYRKYINALRKCAKEHENDRTSTGHIIVSDLCRDTANLLETLEQEPVLDKVRAEIEKEADTSNRLHGISELGLRKALKIIDKYKGESEVEK
jgi:hypothetical protein